MSNRTVTVMAIDPGGVSGGAAGTFRLEGTVTATLRAVAELRTTEYRGDPVRQAIDMAAACHLARPDVLAVESFQLRQRNAELSPVQVTWALRALLRAPAADPRIRLQSPSQAKSFATNDRLRAWGWYDLGIGSDHKRDAMRHLALAVHSLMVAR